MKKCFLLLLMSVANITLFAQSNIFKGKTEEGLKRYKSKDARTYYKMNSLQPKLSTPNFELENTKMKTLQFQFKDSIPPTSLLETKNTLVDESNVEGIITSTFIKNIQKYRELSSFHDSLACVLRDGKYGYINLKGEEVIPCIYTCAQDFSNGVACVTINGKESFIDTKGKTTSPKYNSTKQKQSLILKQHNEKYGYVDSIGNVVIPYKYDGAKDFSEGLAAVRNTTYFNGAEVISVIDDYVDWGFIDEKGKVVIPFKYSLPNDERALFSEGVVIVQKSELFGYVNREGKQITLCKYKQAQPFSNGYAFVELEKILGEQGNKQRVAIYKGYVDKNGKEALVQCGVKEGTIFYEDGMKYVDFSSH